MRKLSLIVLCVLLCGTFAAAQKAELGAGWNYLHVDSDALPSQNGLPGGFFIDGTYYFAKAIGVTGDFEYNKKTFSADTNFAGGEQMRAISFHGGPRVKARMGKFEPFAHALFGFTNLNLSDPSGFSFSDNAFSLKLGGGLDVGVSPHFAIRVGEFNYYLTKFSAGSTPLFNINDHQNNITFGVGVVIR
jgi:opacity protein-like surface antigen